MARLAREENEALKARIAALEAKTEKPGKKSKDSLRKDTLISGLCGFLALLGCSAAITRPVRGPRHPWRLAACAGGEKAAFFH